MSLRKSAQERRDEADVKKRREEWAAEMRARGMRIVSNAEYDELADVVSLLCLSVRRYSNPFTNKVLREKCLALYKEAKQELDKTVRWSDADLREAIPEDGKVIYLPMSERQR